MDLAIHAQALTYTDMKRSCGAIYTVQWSIYDRTLWRHQMETFSALLAFCEGESTGDQCIPLTEASAAELWCFLCCAWTNGWSNKSDSGDFIWHRARHDVTERMRRCVARWYLLCCSMRRFIIRTTRLLPPTARNSWKYISCRADSRFALNQSVTSLQNYAVSHWLGANLESAPLCGLDINQLQLLLVQWFAWFNTLIPFLNSSWINISLVLTNEA